jgi:hypothetical protein
MWTQDGDNMIPETLVSTCEFTGRHRENLKYHRRRFLELMTYRPTLNKKCKITLKRLLNIVGRGVTKHLSPSQFHNDDPTRGVLMKKLPVFSFNLTYDLIWTSFLFSEMFNFRYAYLMTIMLIIITIIINIASIWRRLISFMLLPLYLPHRRIIDCLYARRYKTIKTRCCVFTGRHQLRMMVTEDVDCLSALHAVFHELQLVRIQRRPKGPPDSRHPRQELLLGDLHSRPEFRNTYRPTAFQTPLLRADQVRTPIKAFRNLYVTLTSWKWMSEFIHPQHFWVLTTSLLK